MGNRDRVVATTLRPHRICLNARTVVGRFSNTGVFRLEQEDCRFRVSPLDALRLEVRTIENQPIEDSVQFEASNGSFCVAFPQDLTKTQRMGISVLKIAALLLTLPCLVCFADPR